MKVQNEAGVTRGAGRRESQRGQAGGHARGAWWRGAGSICRCSTSSRCASASPAWRWSTGSCSSIPATPASARRKLSFNVGQGTQDLGFRNDVDILFTARPATKVTLRVLDFDDKPTTGSFLIHDTAGRVYPSQAKRLAPDLLLSSAGLSRQRRIGGAAAGQLHRRVHARAGVSEEDAAASTCRASRMAQTFRLERWIDPAKMGWYSGDHHVHAAGCAHYEKPTEGV